MKVSGWITDDYWVNLCSKAESGDVEAAKLILQSYAKAVEQSDREGVPTIIDENVNRYLANCFNQIIEDTNPRHALNLNKPKSRPKQGADVLIRVIQALWDFYDQIASLPEPVNRNDEARIRELIMSKYGFSNATFKRHNQRFGLVVLFSITSGVEFSETVAESIVNEAQKFYD